jgi:hypothetical protein
MDGGDAMKFDNFAAVCRMSDCHGRIKPRNPKYLSRGVSQKCGMDSDEFERLYRPEEWKARQRIELARLEALRDATCSHVIVKISD